MFVIPPFRVGIDGSNLRTGGGITHLVELLNAAEPPAHGISRVVVWGGAGLLQHLARAPWLELVYEAALDGSLASRTRWQRSRLEGLVGQACDLFFAPGGAYTGRFRPFVTMSRNMLPFEPAERLRYGRLSWMYLKQTLLRGVQVRTMQHANGVIFLNDYARRTVLPAVAGFRGETRVIPHGVDPLFSCPPRVQQPIDRYSTTRPFRLLYVSTIDVYKHQWTVADAVANLRARGVPVTLDLIGNAYGPALARLQATLRKIDPHGEAIKYEGSVAHAELPARYQAADLFVYASSCENMPNILLESMAAGLPIASSHHGPLPEMLGEAGCYFDPEDVGSIETALIDLIESPDRRTTMAAGAHARAQAYSWRKCAAETFEFLRQIRSATR
ncbi:MAG TPA: glycosyltransferase family 1 protein [Vicinamibacterales bacterium]|nr:glycosyltransferase family 1 protein [Vicinamibacterales bacterium]